MRDKLRYELKDMEDASTKKKLSRRKNLLNQIKVKYPEVYELLVEHISVLYK